MPAARPASAACSKAGLKSDVLRSATRVVWTCRRAWLLHPDFKTGWLPEFATLMVRGGGQPPSPGLCNSCCGSLHDRAGPSICRLRYSYLQDGAQGNASAAAGPWPAVRAMFWTLGLRTANGLRCWNLNYGCGDSSGMRNGQLIELEGYEECLWLLLSVVTHHVLHNQSAANMKQLEIVLGICACCASRYLEECRRGCLLSTLLAKGSALRGKDTRRTETAKA